MYHKSTRRESTARRYNLQNIKARVDHELDYFLLRPFGKIWPQVCDRFASFPYTSLLSVWFMQFLFRTANISLATISLLFLLYFIFSVHFLNRKWKLENVECGLDWMISIESWMIACKKPWAEGEQAIWCALNQLFSGNAKYPAVIKTFSMRTKMGFCMIELV